MPEPYTPAVNPPNSSSPLLFPYMVYAHVEATASSWCLSQSGMPVPDASFLQNAGGIDIGPPTPVVMAEFEAGLAKLFGVSPERVIATIGASSAMNFCAARYFRPGTRVAAELPSYEPLRVLPEFFGAELKVITRRAEDDWEITPERLAQTLKGAETGHVILSNPNNPTGTLMSAERMAELAAVTAAKNGVLVSCEAYCEFLPPDRRVHAAHLAPNGISIGTLTKAYGLGGLRLGWLILGEGLVHERAHLRDLSYLGYVDPPTASLRGGIVALRHLPELLQPVRRVEHESRPMWVEWLSETEGVECTVPEFGIIAFPKLSGIDDTLSFARFLAEEESVDVVPGEYFGLAGHIRVGCGVPPETLREALTRLKRGLETWRARGGS